LKRLEQLVNPGGAGQTPQKMEHVMLKDMQDRVFSIHELAQTARGIEDSSFSNPISSSCSAAVYSLFCIETASRPLPGHIVSGPIGDGAAGRSGDSGGSKALHEVPVSELARLMALFRAIQRMLNVGIRGSGWRWALLTRWARLLRGQSGTETDRSEEQAPSVSGLVNSLVEADISSVMAHWLLLFNMGSKNEFDGVLLILWLAQLVQSILCFAKDLKENTLTNGSQQIDRMQEGSTEPEDSEGLKRMSIDSEDFEGKAKFLALVDKVLQSVGIGEFDVSSIDVDLLLDKVFEQCLPFLRRASLLKTVIHGSSLPPASASGMDRSSAKILMKHLHLPSAFGIPTVEGAMGVLITKWCNQLHDQDPTTADVLDKAASRRLTSVTPPVLHPLPQDFHDLLRSVLKRKCKRCGTVPLEPAICLLCGGLVCAGMECCQGANMHGECTQHSISCGAGCAPFLMVKQCLVLIMRPALAQGNSSGCRYCAPYLDSYGEEDPGLKRGRPLRLSVERYSRLQQLWATHRLRAEVARSSHRGHPMTWENI